MTTKKIMLMLMAAMTMVSCNLFIEEEDDGSLEFKDVPVQTGEGYDTPVTVKDGDCEVTYQFREGVRYLTERDQQYIVYVQRDEINALVEIHYRLDTPEELLPVPGEILVSGATDKFDWGCNHKLLKRVKEDGVYKYLGTFCKLQEIYSRLDIDGEVMTKEEETYYVLPEPDDEEENVEAGARTRADDSGTDDSGCSVSFTSSGCKWSAKVDWSVTFEGGPAGSSLGISLRGEENYWSVTTQMKFDNFSLDNMVFQMIKTVEEMETIRINAAVSYSKRIKKFHPVLGKPFTIGPVVIVFFMDIDISLSTSLSGSLVVSNHKKTQYTYTVDIYNMTCTKDEKILIDKPWNFDVEIGGEVSLTVSFIFGFGIYGKVLSVRLVPYLQVGFDATPPSSTGGSWDASNSAGVNFFVKIGGKVQFVVDFTWENLFGSPRTVSEAQVLLDEAKELLDKNSDLYNRMASDKDANDFLNNDNNEKGVTIDIGPWSIKPLCESWTWYPKLKDKSFKIVKQLSDDGTKLVFNAEYTLSSLGIFSNIGMAFYPALMIKRGSSIIRVVPAEEGGSFSEVKKNNTYHFKIENLVSDVEYTAIPCYYRSSINILTSSKPDVVDKSLGFCSHVPSMSLVSVVPTDYEERTLKDDEYKYRHVFKVDSRVSVKGMQSISSWAVKDLISNRSMGQKNKDMEKADDGIYVAHWLFSRYSNLTSAEKRQEVHIKMITQYYLNSSDDKAIEGPPYEIKVYSDRTWDEISDETGFGMEDMSFARRARPQGSTDADADGPTEVILESIEAPDGTIVWQRGQDGQDGVMPL